MKKYKITSSDFSTLEVGMDIHAKDCILLERKEYGDIIHAMVSDSTKTLPCCIHKNLVKDLSLPLEKETTVQIDGVYTYKDGEKILWITKIKPSDAVIVKPLDALSPKKTEYYLNWMQEVLASIRHPGYKRLIQTLFTTECVERISSLPATLNAGGSFPGGALQMSATVLRFVAMCGCDYVRFGNNLYSRGFDFDALFTAAFLQLYGNLTYYYNDESQGKILKTANGLNCGYYATLILKLKETVWQNDITISEAELSFLFNILGSSVRGGHNGIKAISAEGALLKAMNDAFVSLDLYHAEYARLTAQNTGDYGENAPYLYSDKLDAYIVVGQKEEDSRKEEAV